jgi:hypothetical protein
MAHLWPGRDADGVVELAVLPRPDIPSSTDGSWGPPLSELRPWAEPAPDISGWKRAQHAAREAMDRRDREEQREPQSRQDDEWSIKRRRTDAAPRSTGSASDWDATKRAFGEARVRELRQAAAAALGSDEAANTWLDQPEPAMDGMMPRVYAMAHSDCLAIAKPLLATLKTRRETTIDRMGTPDLECCPTGVRLCDEVVYPPGRGGGDSSAESGVDEPVAKRS